MSTDVSNDQSKKIQSPNGFLFSLKNKLLITIMVLPLIAISVIVFMSSLIFKNDKISYIYTTSLSNARSISGNMSAQILSSVNIIKGLTSGYDLKSGKFSKASRDYFNSETSLKSFSIFNNEEVKIFELTRVELNELDSNLMSEHIQSALVNGISIYPIAKTSSIAIFTKVADLVAVGFFENGDIFQLFSDGENKSDMLMNLQTGVLTQSRVPNEDLKQILLKLNETSAPEVTFEFSGNDKHYLISSVKLPFKDLTIVSHVDKARALKAIDKMIARSIAFSVILVAIFFVFGIFAAGGLTYSLRELTNATSEIMRGNFSINIKPSTKDEIGLLGNNFNLMAKEVERLLDATANSARMEAELKTAHTVQETLFPEPNASLGPLNISGSSIPASECGGDWWHYTLTTESKVYVWVGDATGHGVPAALITSAARAAASVIENFPEISPSEAMDILNKAIYDTSKSKLMMTFFIACFDFDRCKMTYSNASHDPPFLLSHTVEGTPKRKDFEPILEINNPRLGESRDVFFKQGEIDFYPGDKIVFYSDGVFEVQNKEGIEWGERKFINSLSKINEHGDVKQTVNAIITEINDFRQGTPLEDDVTLVLVEYKKVG